MPQTQDVYNLRRQKRLTRNDFLNSQTRPRSVPNQQSLSASENSQLTNRTQEKKSQRPQQKLFFPVKNQEKNVIQYSHLLNVHKKNFTFKPFELVVFTKPKISTLDNQKNALPNTSRQSRIKQQRCERIDQKYTPWLDEIKIMEMENYGIQDYLKERFPVCS